MVQEPCLPHPQANPTAAKDGGLERVMQVERSAIRLDVPWMSRCNVIPAYAGIQLPGTFWIPACAGMTIALHVRYVNAPECLTRFR